MLAAALLSVSKVGGWHWCLSFGQELDGDHSCHLLTDLMGCWGGGSCPAEIPARPLPGGIGTWHLVTAMKSHPEVWLAWPHLAIVPALTLQSCCLGPSLTAVCVSAMG